MLDIYNHAVVNTTATFDVTPRSAEAQEQWFLEHVPPHPAIVWEDEGRGRILGWASLSPYAPRCAYRFAAEASVYVAPDARRKGVGEGLLRELIRLGGENGLHTLVGQVTEENARQLQPRREGGLPPGRDPERGRLQVRPVAERGRLPVLVWRLRTAERGRGGAADAAAGRAAQPRSGPTTRPASPLGASAPRRSGSG